MTPEDRGAAGDVGGVRDVAEEVAEIVSLAALRGRRRLPRGRRVQKMSDEKDRRLPCFSRRSRQLPGVLARGRSGRGA